MNVDVARDRPASAFALAQLEIRDPSTYERYARAVPATHVPYGGAVLVADTAPQILEGTWAYDRVVMIRFPGPDAALAWAASDAYRRIAVLRAHSTTTTAMILRTPPRRDRRDAKRADPDEEAGPTTRSGSACCEA